MPLCGSDRTCGCAVTSTAATSGEIDGNYPTINVSGGGSPGSPWNFSLDTGWASAVAGYGADITTNTADIATNASDISDNASDIADLQAFEPDYTSFTPTWAGVTLGDTADNNGRWRTLGNGTIEFSAWIVFGSTSAITSAVTVELPNSEVSASWIPNNVGNFGNVSFAEAAVTTHVGMTRIGTSDTTMDLLAIGTDGERVSLSSTVPFVWGTGDTIFVHAIVPIT